MSIKDDIVHELSLEANAILKVAEQLDPQALDTAFELLKNCSGKVVLTGIGKAGIIGRKISATLASTGTTSIFLHAAEGIHGDLGMLQTNDLVIAISNSGNTQELLSIIPFIKFIGVPLIAFTGNTDSQLAQAADAVLDCYVPPEYEPLGMVPTSSTTVALALGDAFSIALLKHKNFSIADFARFHPGGSIGKKLLLKVKDLMHTGDALPIVKYDAPMSGAILEMTSKKLGCTAVVDDDNLLVGMITDGDLRRQIQIKQAKLLDFQAADCMSSNPKHSKPEELAMSALHLMEEFKITMLPVLDEQGHPLGMLHMHDLIKAGVI
ncbi:MAG: KpsF/GutQ family sugar-phosphate isomerase [Candidatus Cloacimonadaceae bacterium]|nr:KpsF/GutQ family sugar-phosphate isomerase [Candidatus Cloacimonadaceae bacterium]MDP3115441.1 KpsF/GutQ family sugar-phosphate isomerase [Candidatus Cloacimonadaceae bacterium]